MVWGVAGWELSWLVEFWGCDGWALSWLVGYLVCSGFWVRKIGCGMDGFYTCCFYCIF